MRAAITTIAAAVLAVNAVPAFAQMLHARVAQGALVGKPLTTTDKQMAELGDATRQRAVLDPDKLTLFDRYAKAGGQLSLF